MKRVRSYTSIWNVEKVLYALGNLNMPLPATITQIGWGVGAFLAVLMFRDLPPLCFTDNFLLLYLVIPIGTAVLMSKKTFDGKKPYSFLKSAVSFLLRPKQTYAGKRVKYRKVRTDEFITAVRREYYGVSGEVY